MCGFDQCREERTTRNVKELLSEKEGIRFYVPFYQRGYRWTDEEITQLLEDIMGDDEKEYFLQLLVVCKKDHNGTSRYNIVDGQQRLTTIILMLNVLKEKGIALNELGKGEDLNVIEYERGPGGTADDRFMAAAKKTISTWLDYHKEKMNSLKDNLLSAMFLYYEVPDKEEMLMFQQLNTWRIPANDADLVKCIVLSRGNDDDLKRRAQEWDMIEHTLQNDYFWGMLGIREDNFPSRMEAFLKKSIMQGTKKSYNKFPIFDVVKNKSEDELKNWWKELLEKWNDSQSEYGDILRYNWIGWKNNHREGNNIQSITLLQSEDLYYEDPEFVRDYLLLANAAYSWLKGERYNFYRHSKERAISIEHIHARNQHKMEISDLEKIMEGISKFKKEEKEKIFTEYIKINSVEEAEDYLAKTLGESYPKSSIDNSIGNLALLTTESNSSFNNGTFNEKQQLMKDSIRNSDSFFPPLTQAVFLRKLPCLSNNSYWTSQDRETYKRFMENAISNMLAAANLILSDDKELAKMIGEVGL